MKNWYRFTFSDGYYCLVTGMSAMERKVNEKYHGKLISKVCIGKA